MKVKYQIELADVAEIAVEHFNKVMNDVQDYQLIILFLDTRNEIQGGIPFEHYFVVSPFQEMSKFTRSSNDHCANL